MIVAVREALFGDIPALAALEQASPETGPVAIEVRPRVDHFRLAARYPGVRGYVATAPDGPGIVGMLFASVAPTRLDGELVPGAYLFDLRVHPRHRRRGVASALIGHAWERARAEAGVVVAWAAALAGNVASRRTFRRAGFDQERQLRVRMVAPGLSAGRPAVGLAYRPAAAKDLPSLAEALNTHHAGHQLWRPVTGARLADELAVLHHAPEDVMLALGPDGGLVGAAGAFDIGRVAHLRLLGLRALPGGANWLLARLFRRVPLRPLLVRPALLPADGATATAELLRALHRRSPRTPPALAVTIDPLDPAWPSLARLFGVSAGIHLLARSDRQIDMGQPWHFS